MTRKTNAKVAAESTATDDPTIGVTPAATKPPRDTKLSTVERMLRREGGASMAELMTATGWQQHSVRGALAGALKRKGLVIASVKLDGERRYKIGAVV